MSTGYECEHPTAGAGFLKAIDLYKPLEGKAGDVLAALEPLIQEVMGERGLLAECARKDRVISAIDSGDLRELFGERLIIPVPYIIFERAAGTARSVNYSGKSPSHAWCLKTLQQTAVGMWQLHGSMIAHQDTKLSNILVFEGDRGAKLADLGRSVKQGRSVPHDLVLWPGDWRVAPPEYQYGYYPEEFLVRRFSSDLYLLGSCACAVFTGVSVNGHLYDVLPDVFRPQRFNGSYQGTFQSVLPHLKDAFSKVLDRVAAAMPEGASYADEMVRMIREWCDPDPRERGHGIRQSYSAPWQLLLW